MIPNILYASPPVSTSNSLYALRHSIHEVNIEEILRDDIVPRLETRYYVNECFDGERSATMYSVWLDGKPFMIAQDSGRGCQDENHRWITDWDLFKRAVAYLQSLIPIRDMALECADPNKDIAGLDRVYSSPTEQFYNPEMPEPKFKEGDIVMARVLENHMRDKYAFDKAVYIETRCVVQKVFRYNPGTTYYLSQMDRALSADYRTIVDAPNEGTIGATGNDQTVRAMP